MIKILNKISNNGRDARNVIYLSKRYKDAIILNASVVINFASSVFPRGILNIIVVVRTNSLI